MTNDIPNARKKCKWCEHASLNPDINAKRQHRWLCAVGAKGRPTLWTNGYCESFARAPGADDDYKPHYSITGREID